jgi:hypothetical protein
MAKKVAGRKAGKKSKQPRCENGYSVWIKHDNGPFVLTENYCPAGTVPEDPNQAPGANPLFHATAHVTATDSNETKIMRCIVPRKGMG